MIALEIVNLVLISILITLRLGLWVCLTYANPPWVVTRPHRGATDA